MLVKIQNLINKGYLVDYMKRNFVVLLSSTEVKWQENVNISLRSE